jgi:hypothetical protein
MMRGSKLVQQEETKLSPLLGRKLKHLSDNDLPGLPRRALSEQVSPSVRQDLRRGSQAGRVHGSENGRNEVSSNRGKQLIPPDRVDNTQESTTADERS